MKTYPSPYRSLLFLALGCTLSSSAIVYELQMLGGNPPTKRAPQKFQDLAMSRSINNSSQLSSLQNYQEMVNMPLFFKGRQEVAAATESLDDGTLKLTGVVYTPEGYVALMQDKQGAHFKLNQGADVKGWKVGAVQKDRIELVKNTESLELMLFEVHNKRDLTEQDLEACFKNKTNLPLEECFKHPDKYAHKAPKATA